MCELPCLVISDRPTLPSTHSLRSYASLFHLFLRNALSRFTYASRLFVCSTKTMEQFLIQQTSFMLSQEL